MNISPNRPTCFNRDQNSHKHENWESFISTHTQAPFEWMWISNEWSEGSIAPKIVEVYVKIACEKLEHKMDYGQKRWIILSSLYDQNHKYERVQITLMLHLDRHGFK